MLLGSLASAGGRVSRLPAFFTIFFHSLISFIMSVSVSPVQVSVPCFSAGISVTQGVALKAIVSSFRAWSVEHGSIQAHLLSFERELSAFEEVGHIYSILRGGIFFPESGSVSQFLEQAFSAGVYSWYIDRFSIGHITVRLVQPGS